MATLDENAIRAINEELKKGRRVEVIPTKDGVRVVRVDRKTVN